MPVYGVRHVKPILDNQQEKGHSLKDLLSWLRHIEIELIENTANADDKYNTIKKIKTIKYTNKDVEFAATALHEMAQMQNELDTFIIKSRKIEIDNTELVAKLDIAFSVELFELLNECRSLFKYWSKKSDNRSLILEEYADGLHFILSLGNHENMRDAIIDEFVNGLFHPVSEDHSVYSIIRTIVIVQDLSVKAFYFGLLAQLLDFDIDTLYTAYKAKNRKNYARQKEGY